MEDGAVFFAGGVGIVAMLLGILGLVLWIWALVSAIKNPALDSTMRIVWVLVIIFTGFIGAIIYLIAGPRSRSPSSPL